MTDNPLVTIIVPVYNAERYLRKCIASILNQTYTHIEVLLINDGSNDNSEVICKSFLKDDSRIQYFYINNSGVSYTRNTGIIKSNGDYIMFVDSDDWLPTNAVSNLLHEAVRQGADLVYGEIVKVSCNIRHPIIKLDNRMFSTKNPEDLLKMYQNFVGAIGGKLFKRKIMADNNILFNTDIKSTEDSVFLIDYLQNCSNAVSIHKSVYYYNLLNEASATKRVFDGYYKWKIIFINKKSVLLDPYAKNEQLKIDIICKEFNTVITHYVQLELSEFCNLMERSFKAFTNIYGADWIYHINNSETKNALLNSDYIKLWMLLKNDNKNILLLKKYVKMFIGTIKKWYLF